MSSTTGSIDKQILNYLGYLSEKKKKAVSICSENLCGRNHYPLGCNAR